MNRFVAVRSTKKTVLRRAIMSASVAGLATAVLAMPAVAAVPPPGGGWPVCERAVGAAAASEVKASNPDALKVLVGERRTVTPANSPQADPKKAAVGGDWAAAASEVKASNPDALKVLVGERRTVTPAKSPQADPKKAKEVLRAGNC